MYSYQLFLKYIDEWKPAVKIVADEPIQYTITAASINEAIVKVIKNINGIKLNKTHKLVCNETGESQIF